MRPRRSRAGRAPSTTTSEQIPSPVAPPRARLQQHIGVVVENRVDLEQRVRLELVVVTVELQHRVHVQQHDDERHAQLELERVEHRLAELDERVGLRIDLLVGRGAGHVVIKLDSELNLSLHLNLRLEQQHELEHERRLPEAVGQPRREEVITSRRRLRRGQEAPSTHRARRHPAKRKKATVTLPTGKGVPAVTNPSYSVSLPGAAPIGVPNFFIESFAIPPFLLPIYQAAGIEYGVPWQVLAAINEIETDFGRDLDGLSAGAEGWMQFLPSTWALGASTSTGRASPNPYDPVDAIFSAARYLAPPARADEPLPRDLRLQPRRLVRQQSCCAREADRRRSRSALVGALTGLMQGHFPVAAPAVYADDSVDALAGKRVKGANAAIPVGSDPTSPAPRSAPAQALR